MHLLLTQRTDPEYTGSVVSNCSFSKIFSPGIRLGWIEAPYRVLNLLLSSGIATSGGGFNHAMSMIMNSAISLGYLDETVELSRTMLKVMYTRAGLLVLFTFLFSLRLKQCRKSS